MNLFAPLPLTHQVTAAHGDHLLHDIISSICRWFGWRLGSDAARMVPDWLVIAILALVVMHVVSRFIKTPRSDK